MQDEGGGGGCQAGARGGGGGRRGAEQSSCRGCFAKIIIRVSLLLPLDLFGSFLINLQARVIDAKSNGRVSFSGDVGVKRAKGKDITWGLKRPKR